MTRAGLLTLALMTPGAPPVGWTQLQRGDEFTYAGTVSEAFNRTGNRSRRSHDVEVRVLVLEKRANSVDAAVLTLLTRNDDAVSQAVTVVTGSNPERMPPATRLDLVRIHDDGTVHTLLPSGPPPLLLNKETKGRTLPAVPLDSFAPFEFGMFHPRVQDEKQPWTVASTDPQRPAETWQVRPAEFVKAEQCGKLLMVQQSPTWDKPVGGETAWQHAEAVWVSTLDGTARRVHRLLRQRDGLEEAFAVTVEVKFELSGRSRVIGSGYDKARAEIDVAFASSAELSLLAPDAAKFGAKPFEARLVRLDAFLRTSAPGTPYRAAVQAVRRRLEAVAHGEGVTIPRP